MPIYRRRFSRNRIPFALTVAAVLFIAAGPAKAEDGLLDTMLRAAQNAPAKLFEGNAKNYRAGIWSLDLETDKVKFTEFEDASVVLFSTVVNPVRRNETYTVYTQLTKVDLDTGKMERVDLDHTYYDVNVSSDGSELYIGGTQGDIAVYDSKTLERIGNIRTPSGGDQVLSSLRVFTR